MSEKHQGLGILDSPDWQKEEDLKQTWASTPTTTGSSPGTADWKSSEWRPTVGRPAKHYLCRLRHLVWPKPRPASAKSRPPDKLRRTAYLDGLRGFAAFLVYWQHHELWVHEYDLTNSIFDNGFGYEGKYAFCAFPGVRLFFTGGHFAVATFFIISGYVLSAKPLALIHAADPAGLVDNLSSALFRRWLRLYIPLICTTFLYMLSWRILGSPFLVRGTKPQGSQLDEIWHWYAEFKNFSFVFNRGGDPWFSYNFHTWSIPVEMKGSIVVYTAVQSFSRLTVNARLWCSAALAFYFLYIADGWFGSAFMVGVMLCEFDLLASKGELPRALARLQPYKKFICYHLLAAGIYLGGVPAATLDVMDLRKNRGWYILSFLKPQAVFDYKWFYLFWGAVFLVTAIPRIPWLKRFFEGRFCQYLGRVSYSLYLVHGPVLWMLGDRIYAAVGWHNDWHRQNIPGWVDRVKLPRTGLLGLEVAFLLPHIILLPLTFWLAEVCMRMFDEPAVRFASWSYRSLLQRPAKT